MGFSGGGSNILLPHTHDGTISQDGGPLNFNNITQSQSSAGEVFYSDGAHLQQLAYPGVPAGEALVAAPASTSPSWASAGGSWTQVFTDTRTSAASTWANTFTAIPQNENAMFCLQFQCGFSANSDLLLQFHNSGGIINSGYYTDGFRVAGGSSAITDHDNVASARVFREGGTSTPLICTLYITMGNSNFTAAGNERISWWSQGYGGLGGAYGTYGGIVDTNPNTSFDGITATTSAGNFEIGSKVTLWKIA